MPLSIEECRASVAADMERVDDLIRRRLQSDVALVNQLSSYIIGAGGKRLRPQIVLLSAGACDYVGDQHVALAAIIEFIHTATLLHDDVVDASELRRGRETANAVWGNEAAVLVGDFLYSRAFEMMVDVGRMRVMEILASTTNRIAEGEVMQLLNVRDPAIDESRYLEVVEAKTARLFAAAAELGGVLGGRDAGVCRALASYGRDLGIAFQIADDVLDYRSEAEEIGKNVGDDLAEGKPTLPLIIAMRDGTQAERRTVADAIENGGRETLPAVLDAIRSTGAIEISLERAREASQNAIRALDALPHSRHRDALIGLACYSVERFS